MRSLELLSPAADKEVAKQAVLHGADAVYIGGPSHGARSKAVNSIEDIRETVEFAHKFRARVYVTLNTLVYESEIEEVERLAWQLYAVGADALIVQDMSLLRMNLPPIALHASTQCDTRTVDKAKFLEKVGFSQIVLARELGLREIKNICSSVYVPVECFIHGALCVSYSGRCSASEVCMGRSANRGECAQMCRLPYDLINGDGKIIERGKHLLSLRDFNASEILPQLIEAGVSSFKIEGRMKDAGYVSNITSFYRRIIDSFINANPDEYRRSSFGASEIDFIPQPQKSFNRGFTTYFLDSGNTGKMASLDTPKSLGEPIRSISELHNGDGISFFNDRGEYEGTSVNGIAKGKILTSRNVKIPSGTQLYRTFDREWENKMARRRTSRRIDVDITLYSKYAVATDERGLSVSVPMPDIREKAEKPQNLQSVFAKLGNTIYRLRNFKSNIPSDVFIPNSLLAKTRRDLLEALDIANEATYQYDYRKPEEKSVLYPDKELISSDNVANSLAKKFYESHGVRSIEPALETIPVKDRKGERVVMTSRYCIRRELGCCLKDKATKNNPRFKAPLSIRSGRNNFELRFDCSRCEMQVISKPDS